MQDEENKKRRSWKSSKPALAQQLFKPLWSWSETILNIEHLTIHSVWSVYSFPDWRKQCWPHFWWKHFQKTLNSWTERSQAHLKLFKSELRPLGNWKQAAWLPSNEERGIVVRFQPPTIKVVVAHFWIFRGCMRPFCPRIEGLSKCFHQKCKLYPPTWEGLDWSHCTSYL